MIEGFLAVFVVGLIVGSFLNVVIYRIKDLSTIFYTRSKCPSCGQTLKWNDLIPLFSFALLRAKCRYCKKPISWQYPSVEFGTASLFALLFLLYGLSFATFFYALVFSILIVILVYDIKTQYVPENFVWAALILLFIGGGYISGVGFANTLLGGVVGGGAPALLVVLSKEKWMGAGDIKMGMILGLLVGYPVVLFGLLLSFVLGSAVGLFLIYSKKKTMQDTLPFTPFIIISGLLSLLYGSNVVNWYLFTLLKY
ncbi:MAG: prepilin peptidase [Patescibacteria group bacterium]